MKIAFALRHYHKKGGISRSSSHLAEGMVTRGHEVHIFAHSAENLIPGLVFHPVPMNTYPPFLERISYAYNATRLIAQEKFDIINAQGTGSLYRADVVTARSCHQAWVEIKQEQGEYWRYLLNPLHHAILHIEKTVLTPGNFSHIIPVAQGVGWELTQFYGVAPEKITAIPNGVDLERFHPAKKLAARPEILAKHGLAPEDIVLLFTGREFRRKGVALIIEALGLLKNPRLKLLICGSDNPGPYQQLAQRLGVVSQVIFTGRIDAVERYYAASDIFVFPTLYEAFSLSTLEAAASGIPQVVTCVNGSEELIVDGENGFFCKREAAAIAEKIKLLAADPALRQRLGQAARATTEKSHNWLDIVDRTLAIYEQIIQARQ